MTDPIQRLRELMAKADAASATRRNSGDLDSSDYDVACMKEDYADRELFVALRNLAPQLLEVVDRVKTYERFHGDPVAGYVAQCALFDALAALGGKGGGG